MMFIKRAGECGPLNGKARRWLARQGDLNGFKSGSEKRQKRHDKRFIVKRLYKRGDQS